MPKPSPDQPPAEPQRFTFLHLAGVKRKDKAAWVRAANEAGLNLEKWTTAVLNAAAADCHNPKQKKTDDRPE